MDLFPLCPAYINREVPHNAAVRAKDEIHGIAEMCYIHPTHNTNKWSMQLCKILSFLNITLLRHCVNIVLVKIVIQPV